MSCRWTARALPLLLVVLGLAAPAPRAAVLEGAFVDDFDGSPPGSDPADWLDTGADNALTGAPWLFETFQAAGERFFGTLSTDANIHSHYVGPDSAALADHRFSGRLRMGAPGGGIGVTFLSQYPAADAYYRLRRYGTNAFHLAPHGTAMTGGDVDSGVVPVADAWYRFRVEVEDLGDRTAVRARVWPEGDPEPAAWQIDAWDASPDRLVAGRFGVWSFGPGSKHFDDLAVEPLVLPLRVRPLPWTRKPDAEPSVDRQAPGMAPAGISPAPTYRMPFIEDDRLVDDYERPCPALPCTDVVPNLGGGRMITRNGERALRVGAPAQAGLPRWPAARSASLNNGAWTLFLDVEILGAAGPDPALIAKRRDSTTGHWHLGRHAGGPDAVFAWRDGARRSLVFEDGWPGPGRHQVVLTRDRGLYVYYVDGEERGRAFHPDPLPASVEHHDLALGVLESDAPGTDRLDAIYYNVWINVYAAVSAADVAALRSNPWQIYGRRSLPPATLDQPYLAPAFRASGGVEPYAWQRASGALPDGLALGPTGLLGGVAASAAGSPYGFAVRVSDAAGTTASDPWTLEVRVPECADGVDNDADGLVDFRADGTGDPECRSATDPREAAEGGCGLGAELPPVLLGLARLAARRRRRRRLNAG